MSAVGLVRNLKVTIRTLVGLHVVATVCDQHGTNGKAIKMLSEETLNKNIKGLKIVSFGSQSMAKNLFHFMTVPISLKE